MDECSFRWAAAAVIAVAGFLAYANTFHGEFVWDDASSILLHDHVKDPSKILQLFQEDLHPFGRGQGNFYRPLLAVTFMLDYLISAKDAAGDPAPFVFHLSNTLWHVAAALMLFALLCRFKAPRWVAAVLPVLYTLHPLHTEAVAYISGRADPMSAALLFAALWFALWEGTVRRRVVGTILSVLCFAAALLSKESALIFPFLLAPLAVLAPTATNTEPGQQRQIARVAPVLAAAAVLGIYAALRLTVLHFGGDTEQAQAGFAQRFVETGQSLALYLKLIFAPVNLHMERTLAGVPQWVAAFGWATLIVLAAAAAAAWRRQPRIAAGIAWFLITWFPISGLIPLNAPMAEHWMYVPLAGLLWAMAEGAYQLLRHNDRALRISTGILYAAAVVLLVLTLNRNQDWHDNVSLFRATLAQNPATTRVHFNLAVTYEDLEGNLPGARRHYQQVIALYQERKEKEGKQDQFWNEELEAHLSLGSLYMREDAYDLAARHFSTVMQVKPNPSNSPTIAAATFGMGQCFLAFHDTENARQMFQQAVKLDPALAPQAKRLGFLDTNA